MNDDFVPSYSRVVMLICTAMASHSLEFWNLSVYPSTDTTEISWNTAG